MRQLTLPQRLLLHRCLSFQLRLILFGQRYGLKCASDDFVWLFLWCCHLKSTRNVSFNVFNHLGKIHGWIDVRPRSSVGGLWRVEHRLVSWSYALCLLQLARYERSHDRVTIFCRFSVKLLCLCGLQNGLYVDLAS